MKNFFGLLMSVLISCTLSYAQTITFGIANKVTTASSVTFDVTLSSTSPFILGSGQLYFNYNPAAFGPSVSGANNITITQPVGYVFGQPLAYTSFVDNDNTSSRFSFSWQQGLSAGAIGTDNITSTPAALFQVTMNFIPGGEAQPDNICFESSEVFDDQTFTACGPFTPGLNFADCLVFPGTQLPDDNFDCAQSSLPVELVFFEAWLNGNEQVELSWQTQTEINNDYFVVEHATDDKDFTDLVRVAGAGTYYGTLDYKSLDQQPHHGNNYYRLRQVDFDGTTSYSEIRQVRLEGKGEFIEALVYPNPSTGFLKVNFEQGLPADGQLALFDLQGRFVQSFLVGAGVQREELNLHHLAKGAYLLRITSAGKTDTQRLILQ